jgi:hypothetical protein
MKMAHSYDVVAVAHNGEFVCKNCLKGKAERAVFYDEPKADEYAKKDGCLSVVFESDLENADFCGRCHTEL